MKRAFRIFAGTTVAVCGMLAAHPAKAQTNPAIEDSRERLKFVLVLTRHGVRSPTWSNARLDEYAKRPWPRWPVAPGLLTPHGKQLMTLFGTYYRASFAASGLLSPSGCADASRVYFRADTDQRTRETGRGLADGLLAGCDVEVHALAGDAQDELFHPIAKPDAARSQAALQALLGRIGGDPAELSEAYQAPLEAMRQVLFGCGDSSCEGGDTKSLLAVKASVTAGAGDHLAEMKGPLATAATFAEDLQLEYLEGMPANDVGWGRADAAQVRSLMALHAAASDLVQRTPFLAHAQGSNLLTHIVNTLRQAEQGKSVPGAIGTPEARVVFLVGHDTNISNVAALLDAHWLVAGYQRDDAAPGGALVFELWQRPGRPDAVKLEYVVQSPEQMRTVRGLSLSDAPARVSIFLPACSQPETGAPCDWAGFQGAVAAALKM